MTGSILKLNFFHKNLFLHLFNYIQNGQGITTVIKQHAQQILRNYMFIA